MQLSPVLDPPISIVDWVPNGVCIVYANCDNSVGHRVIHQTLVISFVSEFRGFFVCVCVDHGCLMCVADMQN